MASPAMNAALRISQNASRSTLKISHVLSGSTRSLSWTSNQASRASVARNAAAYSVIHSQYLNQQVVQRSRGFSTSAIVEEETSSTLGKVTDAIREREQEEGGAVQERPYGDRRQRVFDREYVPSKTVFVGSIPFFATEEDVRRVFEAAAPIQTIRFGKGKRTHNTPFAHVTFTTLDDAVAVVESAKQEPFYMEGRELRVSYSEKREYPPSRRLFFDNFQGGDLVALREFLGESASWVDNAWFSRERETGEYRPNGIIQFHTVEQATQVRESLNTRPGPDGTPIFMRPNGGQNYRNRTANDGEPTSQQ
ncbi:hypothetical protein EST38_g7918 [Candolleomyces aberdarensis]|uniref:RRM domain-containing protein n=1 Tax=Candolleomyces aberdarensis TaxID=2316362 RepID=A0A4Q2DDZ8_9AGAR|nr:hypothetical protein EST38_g7918 [Candolleomyces aberdarensis]